MTSTNPLPDVRRATAYGRISEDDLDRREGVDDQLSRSEAHIERRGWDYAGTFRDDDVSAWSGKRRPGYEALVAEIVAGHVDTVVVRHLDRLWRDDLEAAKGRALFKQHRVLIAEYGGGVPDVDSPRPAHGADNERQRHLRKRHQVRAGAGGLRAPGRARANERRLPLRLASGSTELALSSGRVMESWEVEHPEEAGVVREIVRRLLAGDSLLALTNDLNDRKHPGTGR